MVPRASVPIHVSVVVGAAAVVGVVLNLGVTFAYHTLFPDTGGFEWYALVASIVAFIGLIRFKWNMIPVIVGSALAGLIWKTIL